MAIAFSLSAAAVGIWVAASERSENSESSEYSETTKSTPDAFIFDNVRLEDIAATLGKYYDVKPVFQDEEAKDLRLYLQVGKEQTIEEVASLLSNFEKITVTLSDGKMLIGQPEQEGEEGGI